MAPSEQYSCTAVPKIDPRRPRRPPDGLIPGPPGHSRPPHTPWGHCGRLGWPVVTCGGHPQPCRRPRTPLRYGCPRVCGSPAGDSGYSCPHQRDGMGSWGVLRGRACLPMRRHAAILEKVTRSRKKAKKAPVLRGAGLKITDHTVPVMFLLFIGLALIGIL